MEINMVKCSYCNQKWVPEEQELCMNCEPKYQADMILMTLLEAVEELGQIKVDLLKRHSVSIELISKKLQKISADIRSYKKGSDNDTRANQRNGSTD